MLGPGSRGTGLCQGHAERDRCAGKLVLGALGCSGLEAWRPEVGDFPGQILLEPRGLL